MPQEREIFPSLTLRENLEVAARPGPWTIAAVFELFPRLKERQRNWGNHLSGGEQQMLAIARALVGNPAVILMDEPSEGLAPVIVEELTRAVRHLADAQGLTLVLVEQNTRLALDISPRTVVMNRGQITYDGASEPLKDRSRQARPLDRRRTLVAPILPDPLARARNLLLRILRPANQIDRGAAIALSCLRDAPTRERTAMVCMVRGRDLRQGERIDTGGDLAAFARFADDAAPETHRCRGCCRQKCPHRRIDGGLRRRGRDRVAAARLVASGTINIKRALVKAREKFAQRRNCRSSSSMLLARDRF